MGPRFAIEVEWEQLVHGPPEERSTFAAIGLQLGESWLTEAHDVFVGRVRQKVHLSAYRLAQWFAWNWWRLRWEPKRATLDWRLAHRLTTIGGGYVWPNVEIDSDGERVLLQASPNPSRSAEPLRYVAEINEALPAQQLQAGIESFVERVLEQLRIEGVSGTNLAQIWDAVRQERQDADAAWYRRLEAAMGYDPDEAQPEIIDALVAESEALGQSGVAELAAGASRATPLPSAKELGELAAVAGADVTLDDIPQLAAQPELRGSSTPAWVVGEAVARAMRRQQQLGSGALADKALAELAGADPAVLRSQGVEAPFSYALCPPGAAAGRVVLHSAVPTSRRFHLARLVGDRVLHKEREALVPIMRSSSYRQKLQRAFAAELLCPFEEAYPQLDAELSEESQERVAAAFQVSPMVVRTQLVNKHLLSRQVLDNF